jgi:hypothetical protein
MVHQTTRSSGMRSSSGLTAGFMTRLLAPVEKNAGGPMIELTRCVPRLPLVACP